MRNTRKLLVGAVAAAVLAAGSAVVIADPAGPGAGAENCAHGAAGPGAMGHGPGAGHGRMGFGPGTARDGMGYGPGGGRGGHGMWSNPTAAVEGYLAALKVELKITPNQDSAWQAFTTKAKQQSETMTARREQMFAQTSAPANQTAPERLAQRTEFAKQSIANMEAMSAAVKDLYGTLTPEQKTLADQQLARGPMGGFGGHRFGRSITQ